MLWKYCTQYGSKFGKHSSDHRTGKRSVFIPIPKKGNAKECSNYRTIAFISHASKVMLKKFSKPGFNSTWTKNFQMFKLDLEKAKEPDIKFPTSIGSSKKHKGSLTRDRTTVEAWILTIGLPGKSWSKYFQWLDFILICLFVYIHICLETQVRNFYEAYSNWKWNH